MNAIVMDTAHSFTSWLARMGNKINRTITRIGYARAAEELARLGYHEEAKRIMLQKEEL